MAFVTGVTAAPGSEITITGVSVTNQPAGADRSARVELAPELLSDAPLAFGAARPMEGLNVVAVSATVPATEVRVRGLTSPGAMVSVVARGGILEMALAGDDGRFDEVFSIFRAALSLSIMDDEEVIFTLTAIDAEKPDSLSAGRPGPGAAGAGDGPGWAYPAPHH